MRALYGRADLSVRIGGLHKGCVSKISEGVSSDGFLPFAFVQFVIATFQ